MGQTPWSAALETGHSAIDDQHRELVRLHAEVLDSMRAGDADAARTALAVLLDRTREHFAFEENLMAEARYPQREHHGTAHSQFIDDLVALVSEGTRNPFSTALRLWLESRYASWWKWHLRSNDFALARHLTAQATPPPAHAPA